MALKEVLVYKRVFQIVLGKEYQWKCTWEVRRITSGTGGNVPGRYSGKLEKLFWPYEMAGKESGSSLPISLQINLFTKMFSTKI